MLGKNINVKNIYYIKLFLLDGSDSLVCFWKDVFVFILKILKFMYH